MVEFDKNLYQEQACVLQCAQSAAECDMEAARIRRDAAIENLESARRMNAPFMLLRPRITLDGDKWCALYGDNLQDGVTGFGDTPEEAERAFNAAWAAKK